MASGLPNSTLGNIADSIKGFMSAPEDQSSSTSTGNNRQPGSKMTESTTGDTTTSTHRAPAVEHETVKPREHQEVNTEVDKDVHKDHYHRTVQPVRDKNVLPTKHTYNENDTSREYDHRDDTAANQFQQEGRKFRDTREVEGTKRTQEFNPAQERENVHHHLHEEIQPVINRETIQPEVVHTTNRVHETHHLNAEHHGASTAPEIDMAQYKEATGTGSGNNQRKTRQTGNLGSNY